MPKVKTKTGVKRYTSVKAATRAAKRAGTKVIREKGKKYGK